MCCRCTFCLVQTETQMLISFSCLMRLANASHVERLRLDCRNCCVCAVVLQCVDGCWSVVQLLCVPSTASPPWWAPAYCGCPGAHGCVTMSRVISSQSARSCQCVCFAALHGREGRSKDAVQSVLWLSKTPSWT